MCWSLLYSVYILSTKFCAGSKECCLPARHEPLSTFKMLDLLLMLFKQSVSLLTFWNLLLHQFLRQECHSLLLGLLIFFYVSLYICRLLHCFPYFRASDYVHVSSVSPFISVYWKALFRTLPSSKFHSVWCRAWFHSLAHLWPVFSPFWPHFVKLVSLTDSVLPDVVSFYLSSFSLPFWNSLWAHLLRVGLLHLHLLQLM